MAKSRNSSKGKNKVSYFNLIAGFCIFLLGLLLILNKDSGNKLISSTFASEPLKFEELKLESSPSGEKPQRIIIPNLKINLEVREAKVVNGYWEVFSDVSGWGSGSGLPGQPGNQVIFAHAREGLFLPLRSIKAGEKVFILTGEKYFEYEITEVKEVNPNDTEVIKGTTDEILTLYTCSGFADSKRTIAVGKRLK